MEVEEVVKYGPLTQHTIVTINIRILSVELFNITNEKMGYK